jgi:hypothetical protein
VPTSIEFGLPSSAFRQPPTLEAIVLKMRARVEQPPLDPSRFFVSDDALHPAAGPPGAHVNRDRSVTPTAVYVSHVKAGIRATQRRRIWQ